METLVETIVHLLNGINKNVVVFVISMCPILELRGGILAASKAFLDIPLHTALPISMIGNLIPIPFILYLIKKIFSLMKKSAFLRGKIERLEKRALSKSDKIQKYEFWGLVLFVGIPLPGTGAWTGALIASLLDLDIRKSFLAILTGLCLAAGIMSGIYLVFDVMI